jgi:hypothetical protein
MATTTKSSLLAQILRAEWSARTGTAVLLLVLFVAGVQSVLLSISKPFWYDEVCTVLVCHLPNASVTWKALEEGIDGQPPAYYFIERFARGLVPDDHLGYRLPSIAGVLATVACIYFILAGRVSRVAALVGASFLLWTSITDYAIEARPYALMLGCISAAILSWQRIEDSKFYALATALCLGGAIAVHYYAILVWPAFVLAEAAILISSRRFRWAAWLAILCGTLPLFFVLPIILQFRQNFGGHFWSQPSAIQAYLADNWLYRMDGNWGLAFALALTATLHFLFVRRTKRARYEPGLGKRPLGLEHLTLCLWLLWLPVIAVAAAMLSHGGMVDRYMLPAALGAALALGYIVDMAPAPVKVFVLFLLLVLFSLPVVSPVHHAIRGSLRDERKRAAREFGSIADRWGRPDLPVVMSDGVQYLPMAFYTPGDQGAQLYTIADPDAAVTYSAAHIDSVARQLVVLQRYFPFQIADYASFISRYREFIVISDRSDVFAEWLPARLIHDGSTLQLLSDGNPDLVYKVTVPR